MARQWPSSSGETWAGPALRACLACAAAGVFLLASPAGASTDGTGPVRLPGKLEAADAVYVTRRSNTWAHGSAALKEIVPEGSHVEEGDVVFVVDATEMERDRDNVKTEVTRQELALAAAQSERDAVEAELAALKEGGEARVAPQRIAVERLKAEPDPVKLAAAEAAEQRAVAQHQEAAARLAAVAELAADGTVSKEAHLEARFAAEIAEADVALTRAELAELREGAEPHDITAAELELESARVDLQLKAAEAALKVAEAKVAVLRARASLSYSRERLASAELEVQMSECTAPKAGTVVYEKVRMLGGEEETVKPGVRVEKTTPVASIISGREFRFRAKAGEALLGWIKEGMTAEVELEALGDRPLKGAVHSFDVSLKSREKEAVSVSDLEVPQPKVFDVLISLEDVPEGLMPGLSGEAVLECAAPATGPAAGEDNGLSTDGSAVTFPGFLDAQDKVGVFSPGDVQGSITKIVPQYAALEEGDVILECTGDRARAELREAQVWPEVSTAELDLARTGAEARGECGDLAVRKAELALRIAEVRLEKARSQPRAAAVAVAERKVAKAEKEEERAARLFEIAAEAGLDAQSELEKKELAFRLADVALTEARVRLAQSRKHPREDDLARYAAQVTECRTALDLVKDKAEAARDLQAALTAEAQMRVENSAGSVAVAEGQFAKRIVRAPASGNIVFARQRYTSEDAFRLGDYLPNWPLEVGYICDLAKLKFSAVVDQAYGSRIKPGDEAGVSLLAVPGRLFRGTVSTVVPLVRDREENRSQGLTPARYSGVRTTRVDVLLDLGDGVPVLLLPGMTGTAVFYPSPPPSSESGDPTDAR